MTWCDYQDAAADRFRQLAAKQMEQALTALSAGWRLERQRSTGSSQAK